MASWCFAKSSKRFHQWLHQHPKLGPIIKTWSEGSGIPRKARNKAIATIVICMSISAIIVGKLWLTILLACIGGGVITYLYRIPVLDEDESAFKPQDEIHRE